MYLDTNFFVYARFSQEDVGRRARRMLKKIQDGQHAITSVLTIDELMWVMRKQGLAKQMREVIEDIFSIATLSIVEVSPSIALASLDFVEKYNLKPRDAFHAATMKEFNEKKILSDDKDFDRVPE